MCDVVDPATAGITGHRVLSLTLDSHRKAVSGPELIYRSRAAGDQLLGGAIRLNDTSVVPDENFVPRGILVEVGALDIDELASHHRTLSS